MPLRIYQNCPVHIDTAFYVPAGTKRQVVFKDMPKDHEGKHYFVNKETGKVFSEFDPIDLPDATQPTAFPMTFEHYAITPGDPVYKDGYEGAIIAETKINGATVKYDTIRYQYFQHPTATLDYQKPGPRFAGKFELRISGELLKPEYYVGYEPKTASSIKSEANARTLSNFNKYTAGAYFSIDNGATWIKATPKGFTLETAQIEELPNEVTVLMRLPYGCESFILASSDGNGSHGNLPKTPFDITRQITLNNETGDASPTLVEPLKQYYDVKSGSDFVLTVRPSGNNVPTLTTSRNGHLSDAIGVKTEVLPDGAYRFTVRKVKENLTLTLKYTVGNAEVDGTRVWGEAGNLCITSAATSRTNVYNALGRLTNSLTLSAGETRRLPMTAGIYIVTLNNGRAYKAAVR